MSSYNSKGSNSVPYTVSVDKNLEITVSMCISKKRKGKKCRCCFQVLYYVALFLIHKIGTINNAYNGVMEMKAHNIKYIGKILELVIGRVWMWVWLACFKEHWFYLLCIDNVHYIKLSQRNLLPPARTH